VKLGTCGRKSYGFGGTGRSAMAALLASGRSDGGHAVPLATLGSRARFRRSAVQRSTRVGPRIADLSRLPSRR
jgi:hypothetical protein